MKEVLHGWFRTCVCCLGRQRLLPSTRQVTLPLPHAYFRWFAKSPCPPCVEQRCLLATRVDAGEGAAFFNSYKTVTFGLKSLVQYKFSQNVLFLHSPWNSVFGWNLKALHRLQAFRRRALCNTSDSSFAEWHTAFGGSIKRHDYIWTCLTRLAPLDAPPVLQYFALGNVQQHLTSKPSAAHSIMYRSGPWPRLSNTPPP
jgi:hypothetical protein